MSENKFQQLNGEAEICTLELVALVKKKSLKKCTNWTYHYINLSNKLKASRKFIILFADYNLACFVWIPCSCSFHSCPPNQAKALKCHCLYSKHLSSPHILCYRAEKAPYLPSNLRESAKLWLIWLEGGNKNIGQKSILNILGIYWPKPVQTFR